MTTPNLRTRVLAFAETMDHPMTIAEIAAAIGGRGITPMRVQGFLKGCDKVVFVPEKRVMSGICKGKAKGTGKWKRVDG